VSSRPSRCMDDIFNWLGRIHDVEPQDVTIEIRSVLEKSGEGLSREMKICVYAYEGEGRLLMISGRGSNEEIATRDACAKIDHLWDTRGMREQRCSKCGKPAAVPRDEGCESWICRRLGSLAN
jgi:hypothetical protein